MLFARKTVKIIVYVYNGRTVWSRGVVPNRREYPSK